MIPITANVSNALVHYHMAFGKKITIGEIPTSYNNSEDFVADIEDAIRNKNPIFGGEYIKRRGRPRLKSVTTSSISKKQSFHKRKEEDSN